MAARRRNGTASRSARGGGRGRRNASRRGSSSGAPWFWVEIGGAALLAVVAVVAFSGGKSEAPPRKAEPVKPATRYIPKYTPPPKAKTYGFLKKAGKKPDRPAPRVDLSRGRKLYEEARKLWDESVRERNRGGGGAKARETLHKAYRLLEQALNSVDAFNLWVEEAELKDWAVEGEALRAKREVDKWFNLQSRIHKILPQAGK